MQILYFEDETEKKLRAENLKVKAENEELRGKLAEKDLKIYHLEKDNKRLKNKILEDCDVILIPKK